MSHIQLLPFRGSLAIEGDPQGSQPNQKRELQRAVGHQAGPPDSPIGACFFGLVWTCHQCPALGSQGEAQVSPWPSEQARLPSMAP